MDPNLGDKKGLEDSQVLFPAEGNGLERAKITPTCTSPISFAMRCASVAPTTVRWIFIPSFLISTFRGSSSNHVWVRARIMIGILP